MSAFGSCKFPGIPADRTRLVGGGVLDAPSRKAAVFAGSTLLSGWVLRDCTPRALPRASRSGRHVGLWPPRNDKSESFTPQNAYRKSCQSAWRSASALYRGIKPQEGTGAPRVPLTCHCEERNDVAISQYPAGSWGSYRRNRSCLPEIAPQGHFLALRAQGATSACGLLAMTNLRASRHRMRTAKVASLHGAQRAPCTGELNRRRAPVHLAFP